jgi:mRNA interferase MazF
MLKSTRNGKGLRWRNGHNINNKINNEFSGTVTILPITGQSARKQYPFEVLVPNGVGGLTVDSRIKANQVRTVDKRRLVNFRGSLCPRYLARVGDALKVHLNLA